MIKDPYYLKLKEKAIEAGYDVDTARQIPLENIRILAEIPPGVAMTGTFLKNMRRQLVKEFTNRTNRSGGQWIVSRLKNHFPAIDNSTLIKFLRAAARILEAE